MVPARNKERHVQRCIASVLATTYPCEILLSDQGSTDRTREILVQMVAEYQGPHTVRLVDCPNTEAKGMAGLNAHINWLMDQTDADIIVISAADDITEPERVAKTVEAYEEFNPSMVLTGMWFLDENLGYEGENAYPSQSGWVNVDDCISKCVAGSTSISWTREFWDKIKPHPAIIGNDVFMPFLAILEKGTYYLHDRLHSYIKYADPSNTGLEGVWRAADEAGKLQLEELMHFQTTTALYSILACMDAKGWVNEDAKLAIYQQVLNRAASWTNTRQRMTFEGIPPIPLPT